MAKKIKFKDVKVSFNDMCMRELGLDYDEDTGYIYDIDNSTILQINEKFLKYCEDGVYLKHNEIDFNMIENSKLLEILFNNYLLAYANRVGIEIKSTGLSKLKGTNKGYAFYYTTENGYNKEVKSDLFENESVRIFNLLCKINETDHMYDFEKYDITE